MKKLFYLATLILVTSCSTSTPTEILPTAPPPPAVREIALTFDDGPRGYTPLLKRGDRPKMLIESLRRVQAPPAIFFIKTGQFDEVGPEGVERTKNYAAAGHFLGNHTQDHPDFNLTATETYLAGIKKAHNQLKKLKGFIPYFRFPYLREGDTPEKLAAGRSFLKKLNLKNGYVTANTYDWSMDDTVQKALFSGKKVDLEALKKLYVETISQDVEYYDRMARLTIGRSPKHVLLLHENDLAALFVGDLVEHLRAEGWKIIPANEAFNDEISAYESAQPVGFNPGRIGEIARDKHGWEGRKLWSPRCSEEVITKYLSQTGAIR